MVVASADATIAGSGGLSASGWQVFPYPSGKSVGESLQHQSQLASALKAGLSVISQDAIIVFRKYLKVILPLDGFVFWVRADLLSDSALANVATFNGFAFNQPTTVVEAAQTLAAAGSLHVTTTNRQDSTEGFSVNRMVFTSKVEVNDLNGVNPSMMYIAEVGGLRFAFSERGSFYRQADLYHYVGDAVYPVMATQVIDDPAVLNTRSLVISNSLPVWLRLNRFMPMYPSFLVRDNVTPPYGAVDIPPESTQAIQAVPVITRDGSHWQLVKERVTITLFGLRNFNALDFQDYLLSYMADSDVVGLMNMPVIRDEKRTQTELGVIAMKKTIDLEVSYNQARIQSLARQLILEAIPTFYVGGGVDAVSIN